MNREEAYAHFQQTYGTPLTKKANEKFIEQVKRHQETLKEMLTHVLKEFLSLDYPIYVVHFTLPRTRLFLGEYHMVLKGYDHTYYFDTKTVEKEVPIDFLFQPFIELQESLEAARKTYVSKINPIQVTYQVMEEAIKYYKLLTGLVRLFLVDMESELLVNHPVLIRWGEYEGEDAIVFNYDPKIKDEETFKKMLTLIKDEPDTLIFTAWQKSSLKGCKAEEVDMRYIRFYKSELEEVVFKKCNLEHSRFIMTRLKNIDFSESNLKKACFRKSQLENCNFEGADVSGAIFDSSQVPYLHLSAKQLQSICIEEGK